MVTVMTPAPAHTDERPEGHVIYQTRQNFRDLCRIYGFGGAREIVAEIINSEAERKSHVADRA